MLCSSVAFHCFPPAAAKYSVAGKKKENVFLTLIKLSPITDTCRKAEGQIIFDFLVMRQFIQRILDQIPLKFGGNEKAQ